MGTWSSSPPIAGCMLSAKLAWFTRGRVLCWYDLLPVLHLANLKRSCTFGQRESEKPAGFREIKTRENRAQLLLSASKWASTRYVATAAVSRSFAVINNHRAYAGYAGCRMFLVPRLYHDLDSLQTAYLPLIPRHFLSPKTTYLPNVPYTVPPPSIYVKTF